MMLNKHTTRWNPDLASPQIIQSATRGYIVSVLEPKLEVIFDVGLEANLA